MDNQLEKNKLSPRRRAVNLLVHVFLAVLAIIWLLPIAWIVLTSFRAEPGAYTTTFLPQGYTLDNYIKLLTDRNVLDFPKMFMNTLIISIFSCIISTAYLSAISLSGISSMQRYNSSRLKLRLMVRGLYSLKLMSSSI